MASGNPALNEAVFAEAARTSKGSTEIMTLDGTAIKAGLLGVFVIAGASYTWSLYFTTHSATTIMPWIWISSIAGFIVALVTIFNKTLSPYTSPLYAALEGLCLGGLSALFESKYPGIAIQSVGLTFAILGSLLFIYATGLIKPSENFKIGVAAATGGICIYYLVALGMSFFGMKAPLIWDSGPFGIGFSVFVIIIASLNLVVDFDFIEQGVKEGAPKYMEWYGAFGLMVTLVWLYLEVLRLLAKMRKR